MQKRISEILNYVESEVLRLSRNLGTATMDVDDYRLLKDFKIRELNDLAKKVLEQREILDITLFWDSFQMLQRIMGHINFITSEYTAYIDDFVERSFERDVDHTLAITILEDTTEKIFDNMLLHIIKKDLCPSMSEEYFTAESEEAMSEAHWLSFILNSEYKNYNDFYQEFSSKYIDHEVFGEHLKKKSFLRNC